LNWGSRSIRKMDRHYNNITVGLMIPRLRVTRRRSYIPKSGSQQEADGMCKGRTAGYILRQLSFCERGGRR
jgi:hypothetical protein